MQTEGHKAVGSLTVWVRAPLGPKTYMVLSALDACLQKCVCYKDLL